MNELKILFFNLKKSSYHWIFADLWIFCGSKQWTVLVWLVHFFFHLKIEFYPSRTPRYPSAFFTTSVSRHKPPQYHSALMVWGVWRGLQLGPIDAESRDTPGSRNDGRLIDVEVTEIIEICCRNYRNCINSM